MGRKLYKVLLGAIFALIISSFSAKTYALDISQQDLVVSAHSSSLTIHNNGIGTTDFQITPQLEFNKLGDFITYKLIVHNNDGKRYKIANVKDDNTNDAIELTYAYPTDLDVNDKSLELTIKYVKKSTTPLQTVTATISLVDEDDVSQQITIVVPNTGTNTITDTRSVTIKNTIFIYVAVAATVVTIYIIVRRKYQRARK